jgi:hypothetical protein
MLLKLAAYFLVLFLTAQAFRGRKDLYKLAWFVMAFCFAVSLLAIIQHFTSGSEIYWMSDLKIEGDPFGPYVNRNHFAGFVELTLPMGLALMAFHGVRRDLIPLATLLTIVPISALILSASRAGIIGFGLEVGILVLMARSRKAWQGGRTTAAAIVALAALAIVAWVGTGRAIERFSGSSVHGVTVNRRVSMFRGAAHIFSPIQSKAPAWGRWWMFFQPMKTPTTAGWLTMPMTITSKDWPKLDCSGGSAAQSSSGGCIARGEKTSWPSRGISRVGSTRRQSWPSAGCCFTASWISTCRFRRTRCFSCFRPTL